MAHRSTGEDVRVPRYFRLEWLSMYGSSMCPLPENCLARASGSLNACAGQEQHLTRQGAKGALGKCLTAWNCRMPTAAKFLRVSSAVWLIGRVWPLQGS